MKRLAISSFLVILSVQYAASVGNSALSPVPPWMSFNSSQYIMICNISNNAIINSGNTALTATFTKLSSIGSSFSKFLSNSSEITTNWNKNASTMVQTALIVHLEDFVRKMALRLQGVTLYALGKKPTMFHTPQSLMLELQNPKTYNTAENVFKLAISWIKDLSDYSTVLNPSSATLLSNQWLTINRIIQVPSKDNKVTQIDPKLIAALDATVRFISDVIEVTKVFIIYAKRENFVLNNLNQWNSFYGMIEELHEDRRDMALLTNVHLYNGFSANLEIILDSLSNFTEQFLSTNLVTQLNTFQDSMKTAMNAASNVLKNSIIATDRSKTYAVVTTSKYFERDATAAFGRLKYKDNPVFSSFVLAQSMLIDNTGRKSDIDTVGPLCDYINIGSSYTAIINEVLEQVRKCTVEEIRSRACLKNLATASRAATTKATAVNSEETRKLTAAINKADTALTSSTRTLYAEGYQKSSAF